MSFGVVVVALPLVLIHSFQNPYVISPVFTPWFNPAGSAYKLWLDLHSCVAPRLSARSAHACPSSLGASLFNLSAFRLVAPESAQRSECGPFKRNIISHIFFVKGECFLKDARSFFPHIFCVWRGNFFENAGSALRLFSDHLWNDFRKLWNVVKSMQDPHVATKRPYWKHPIFNTHLQGCGTSRRFFGGFLKRVLAQTCLWAWYEVQLLRRIFGHSRGLVYGERGRPWYGTFPKAKDHFTEGMFESCWFSAPLGYPSQSQGKFRSFSLCFFCSPVFPCFFFPPVGGLPGPVPFVRIHSGNNSKIVFLCICICYEIKTNSKTISICYAAPSKLQRTAVSASATKI